MTKRTKKILFVGVVFVALLCLPVLIVLRFEGGQEFDSAAWKNKQLVYAEDPIRKKMVHRLLKYGHLTGKPRSEIDAMLGSPDQKARAGDYDYVYWLGPEGGYGVDSAWLAINFDDKTDRVVLAKIVTD